ncbi:MAG TPA: ammonium transporter [Tepidisphaeraceae bacterium]
MRKHRHRGMIPSCAFVLLLLSLGSIIRAQGSGQAAPAEPDPIGAFQLSPSPMSVPGYTSPDPEKATTKELAGAVDAVAQSASRSYYSINFVWTLICGFLIMFMQAGFALIETGVCRAKNASNTMSMNFMVYALAMMGFFVCGFAFMCGGAHASPIGGPGTLGGTPTLANMFTIHAAGHDWGLFGRTGFFLAGGAYDARVITWFLFMMVFMDTTATIPTGCAAERWSWKSFCLFTPFIGALIYVVYGNWVWGGGWLAQLGLNAGLGHGAVDYAGSSVVHMQGGVIALVIGWLLGPRIGKYDAEGRVVRPIAPHHIPMVVLGTFILAFGWFGFNAGSSLAGSDGRIGIIAANTMLSSGAAAISAMITVWLITGKPDPSMMCNGMLAGLVAITAPCAFVAPWVAFFFIGGFAGILVVVSVFFFDKIGIDDAVGAISVHGVNGLWGILAVGLFADGTYGFGFNGVGMPDYMGVPGRGVTGLVYGDSRQFLAQCIAAAVCFVWNFVMTAIIFTIVGKVVGGNRVPPEVEIAGLDIPEMGAPGYPEFIDHIAPEQVSNSDIAAAREGLLF